MSNKAQMLEKLLQYRKAGESYLAYVQTMYPQFTLPDFQIDFINTLDKFEKRELFVNSTTTSARNLLITMPPRHAKSTWGTINFPTYFLGRDPRRQVMTVSYNSVLAKGFGRAVRNIIKEPSYANIFPDSKMAVDRHSSDHFSMQGGGNYYGIGLNGTTTGRAANLLLIDDPIKSRVEAESALHRDRVWDFYTGSLSNRREPEPNGDKPLQAVVLTRWHPDDLAGRIMETDEWRQGLWHHINFQALTEIPDSDPKQYKALWPDRFSVIDLERQRNQSARDFEALYQQQPVIQGGNLIKTDWFQRYEEAEPSYMSMVVTADTAFKTKQTADYTVFMVLGLTPRGDIHIVDVHRGRWDFPETKRRAIALNTVWRGRGLRGFYVEDRASGQSLIQELRVQSGIAVIPYKERNVDKVSRVNVTLPIIEGGRVFIPEEAVWLEDFLKETSQFPAAPNDDIVDALIMGLDVLSRMSVSASHIEQLFDLSQSIHNQPVSSGGNSLNSLLAKKKAPRPLGF